MNSDLFDDICDIEAEFCQMLDLLQILKDAVENNYETSYLVTYIDFLQFMANKFADSLEKYNQKIGKKLCEN